MYCFTGELPTMDEISERLSNKDSRYAASGWQILRFVFHLTAIYAVVKFFTPYLARWTRTSLLPLLQLPTSASSFEFLFSHLLAFSFVPAFLLGLLNSRFKHKIAQFVWLVPASILGYKLAMFSAPSVLDNQLSSAFYHYFNSEFLVGEFRDWQSFWATLRSNADTLRGLDQLWFTAPFYAGVGYSLGAWIGLRTDVNRKVSEKVKAWEASRFDTKETPDQGD